MNLAEIKMSVQAGNTVHWANDAYKVIKDDVGQWLIQCDLNNNYIGLTWRDGVTMNGREEQFYNCIPRACSGIWRREQMNKPKFIVTFESTRWYEPFHHTVEINADTIDEAVEKAQSMQHDHDDIEECIAIRVDCEDGIAYLIPDIGLEI